MLKGVKKKRLKKRKPFRVFIYFLRNYINIIFILWRIKSKNPKFVNYTYFTQPSEILSVDDVDNCESQNLQLDSH